MPDLIFDLTLDREMIRDEENRDLYTNRRMLCQGVMIDQVQQLLSTEAAVMIGELLVELVKAEGAPLTLHLSLALVKSEYKVTRTVVSGKV